MPDMYRLIRAVVVLTIFWLAGPTAGADPGTPSPPAAFQYPPHVQAFFTRLKALADTGDLFDPTSVAGRLDMKLQAETKERIPQPANCKGALGFRSHQTTTVATVGETWYRPMPGGLDDMPIPAAFINPATSAGQAAFTYSIQHTVGCSDRFSLVDQTSASLGFSGLPSFACVSARGVLALLPGSKWNMATDGVSLVQYQGRLDDDVRVGVDVYFRAGAPCAIGATVTQSQREGLRYQRAEAKRRNCGVQVTRTFCADHKPFGWGGWTGTRRTV
jgi:hypothetical protein